MREREEEREIKKEVDFPKRGTSPDTQPIVKVGKSQFRRGDSGDIFSSIMDQAAYVHCV